MAVEQNREVLKGLFTIGDLVFLFNKGPQTINIWRRRRGLPFVEIRGDSRPAIRFWGPSVLHWAMSMGICFDTKKAREMDVDRLCLEHE